EKLPARRQSCSAARHPRRRAGWGRSSSSFVVARRDQLRVGERRCLPAPSSRRQQKERRLQKERDGHLISYFSLETYGLKLSRAGGRSVNLDSPMLPGVVNDFLTQRRKSAERCRVSQRFLCVFAPLREIFFNPPQSRYLRLR